jgi:hypothetical protein
MHTKMKRLCRRMDIPLWQAVGLMESLWLLTGRETPRGDIGKLSNEDIALAIDYRGAEGELIEALVACGWIDRDEIERLVIHDWADHADDAVHMRLARSQQFFVGGRAPRITKLSGIERERAHKFYERAPELAHEIANCAPELEHGVRTTHESVRTNSAQDEWSSAPPEPEPRQSPAPPELVPEPSHTPEPAERARVRTTPRAADLYGTPSPRFDELWNKWPRKSQRDRAVRDWISYVNNVNEAEAMACADRYLASDEVNRGVVMQLFNWLEQQHRDAWKGDWPKKPSRWSAVR